MNVTVENLAPCKKLVRVEVDAETVDKGFAEVTKDFQKQASLPGFRPGKAPVAMVLRKYEEDIKVEAKRKLISDAYRKAIEEQKLDVLGQPDIEEIQFGRSQPLQFAATVETAPEFELPEYKAIPVKVPAKKVTDEDVASAIEVLRNRGVQFTVAERPAQNGDVTVVNYTGTVDGKPITELAPTAKGLTAQQAFWVELGSDAFIPGFAEQLLGAKAGDKRTVNVDFPADFVTPALAGKRGVYEVEVVEVREKVLPPIDEALAKQYGAESLEKLREGVRRDLEHEMEYSRRKSIQNQIIKSLLNRATFELPETAVARETRNVVYDIVQENTRRGLARQVIEGEKERIFTAATQGAQERVKIAFLLQKIAEKEDVKVSEEEIGQRIHYMAATNNIPVDRLVKDLRKRNGIIDIYDQIMNSKVMELLEKEARVEEEAPAQA